MSHEDLQAPIPIKRNKVMSHLNLRELAIKRFSDERQARTPGVRSPEIPSLLSRSPLRARSATPTRWKSPSEFKTDMILNDRMKHYDLDYPEDETTYKKALFDPESRWFSRNVKPKFRPSENLPYKIETHQEQAKYLCHVLVNLYIAISSLDVEGSISISNKDLGELKSQIDDLALKTDIFRIAREDTPAGYESFDDEELYNENDYINAMGPDAHSRGKITTKSSSIINVNHWTNELQNCLIFDIPLTLRKSLATVYYYLVLVKGQKVARDLHIQTFEILVDTLDEGEDFTALLNKSGLVLDHKPLFKFFCSFLPYPDADYTRYDLSSKDDSKLFKSLLRLAIHSRPFFDENDESIVKESMDILLSSFSPATLSTILPIMAAYIPCHYHKTSSVIDYFPFCFSLWTSVNANVVVDTNLFDFVGHVAEDIHSKLLLKGDSFLNNTGIKLDKYGIFTDDQMTFLFNRLQGHLRTNAQVFSYSKMLRPFIYSIMSDKEQNHAFFDKLGSLMRSLETYIYPSNMGVWTKPIAKFIHTFIKMYHARVQLEKRSAIEDSSYRCLTVECNSEIVDMFLNTLRIGAQNKNVDVANYYISCFAYLLDLESTNRHLIFDRVLEDMYDALSGEYIEAKHRIFSAFKQFTRVVRFMTIDKLYRVHITNILTMLIDKIDSNDLILTGSIINIVVSIVSFTPFKSLVGKNEYLSFQSDTIPFVQQHYMYFKENSKEPFEFDNELLERSFRASTTEFKNIILQYIDKLYQLVDDELTDNFVVKLNQTTLMLIEALDEQHLDYFADIFVKQFWDNEAFKGESPYYVLISTPMACLVRRKPSLINSVLEMLMINMKEQVERGGGSVRDATLQGRDIKLALYLITFNEVLRFSYDALIPYKTELQEFIKYLIENISNPVLDSLTTVSIHNILSSLTTTEIIGQEMFSELCSIPDEDRWGGLQFDSRKFDPENLNFRWHIPSKAEVETTFELFQWSTDLAIEKIEEILSIRPITTKTNDHLQKYMLLLGYGLSGSSLLFDSNFNKNIHSSKVGDQSSYREKLLLLKYVREKKYDTQDLNIDIEQINLGKEDEESSSEYGDNSSVSDSKSDIVVVNDYIPDELYAIEDGMSEVPSAICTPVPGQSVPNSSLNGDLSFRDLDIYKCNYYFGSTVEENFENPLYFEFHKVRSKIGLFYHKLYGQFNQNYENSTTIHEVLLHGMSTWFMDLGHGSFYSDTASTMIDVEFIENLQSLSHLDQLYTRVCLSSKVNGYHQDRVIMHSTNRYPSKLEVQLLRDLVNLSMSAYPDIQRGAQGCLVECMKQLIGSYSIVSKQVTEALKESLENHSNKKVDACLKVCRSKKILSKMIKDYKSLGPFISLVLDCCNISEFDIDVHADIILTDIMLGIKIPPSVCLYDERMYKAIAPPDSSINLQVEAVKKAKENKRKLYLEQLTELNSNIVKCLDGSQFGWRTQVFLIRFITKIQSDLEMPTDAESLKTIFVQSYSNHPKLIHLVLKSLLSISNKILALSDYNHTIVNSIDDSFDPETVKDISTEGDDFKNKFLVEMNNFSDPQFFIDTKAYQGWLCWGKNMKVITSHKFEINLTQEEEDVFRTFGSLITREYLDTMITALIKDNETRVVFSSSEVSYFVVVIILISKGFTSLTFNNLCEMCESFYVVTDKASMIISVEIIGAMMYSTKYITKDKIKTQEIFLEKFISKCINEELNQDAFDIWSTLCWWLPCVIDVRRCQPFVKHFATLGGWLDATSDRVNDQCSRLMMLRNVLTSLEYRSFEIQPILDGLIFDHPYVKVREATARLFTTLIQNDCYPSMKDSGTLLSANSSEGSLGLPLKQISERMDKVIKSTFATIAQDYTKVISLSPQDIIKTKYFYLSSFMFYWIREMVKGPNRILLIPYVTEYVIPFLRVLLTQKDVCKLGGIDPGRVILNLGSMAIRKSYIKDLIGLLSNSNASQILQASSTSSYQIRVQLIFLEFLLSNLLLQLTEDDKNHIYDFIIHQLHNPTYMEVRVQAAAVLSDIVHNMGATERVQTMCKTFDKVLQKYTWQEKKTLSKTDIEAHASLLGLGAIINAFPYVFPLPSWIPTQLAIVSTWARTNGMCGTAAKDTINKFKKVRADTWKFDRASFTSDELEDLEGVLWRSYYA
ncbi:similar to Saccharomyces cerevisiae YFL007W BLM10 Proteasome activator subunit [Maudiozyma barnettii]|uniref:Similar to Saccharomyces cerevisiae YFL007W BLM10 Proteasome activator subunit n=1 Tax=Maudiozyma barnettii TaxID=61262 RepID=A0A8H2ZFK1_9SACH|nr:Blm10p [Kazachstania barnettii]CAB4252445.1 similar to Saccharomyces cerevisiae YFL007W BLM10 Proteasome activator subunit [Kazachstania barnettii]CAD1779180.1 similar to Saccharomyces cerevisiae YFL007W BLM10 Proteasome activator subunit [Kazachstania barnettii]